jgi:hypothetical protein
MDTQLGYWRWKLFRWNEHPNPYRNRADLAFTWLSQFQANAAAMQEIQNLLRASVTGAYPPTDPKLILEQVAEKMSTGEIQVCAEICGPVALNNSAGFPAGETDELPIPVANAPAPAPPAPEPQEQPTLGPDSDAQAQAQVLKNAAEDGVPFCEECAKKAAAAEAASKAVAPQPEPPAPEPTLGQNNDAAAQAQVLRDAAQSGAHFCEICERMARQAQQSQQDQ